MAGPGGGPPRRSHTKSRKGCETCKKRHIRCDETFPQCRNCTKHKQRCPYQDMGDERAASPETPQLGWTAEIVADIDHWRKTGVFPLPIYPAPDPNALTEVEMRLIHHVASISCQLTVMDANCFTLWTHQIPTIIKIGATHRFVLEALLAFSAMHLSFMYACPLVGNMAYEHRGRALAGLHEAINTFSQETSDAILAASLVLSWQATDWPSWTQLMQGTSTVIEAMDPWKHTSQFGDFIRDHSTCPTAPPSPRPDHKPTQPSPEDVEVLNRTHHQLQRVEAHMKQIGLDSKVLAHFADLISFVKGARKVGSSVAHQFDRLQPFRQWVFWLPVLYLQQTNGLSPSALVVIAHYYTVALLMERLFPEIGAAYFGSLAVGPVEEIARRLHAFNISGGLPQDDVQTPVDLMQFPLNMVDEFRSRMGWNQPSRSPSFPQFNESDLYMPATTAHPHSPMALPPTSTSPYLMYGEGSTPAFSYSTEDLSLMTSAVTAPNSGISPLILSSPFTNAQYLNIPSPAYGAYSPASSTFGDFSDAGSTMYASDNETAYGFNDSEDFHSYGTMGFSGNNNPMLGGSNSYGVGSSGTTFAWLSTTPAYPPSDGAGAGPSGFPLSSSVPHSLTASPYVNAQRAVSLPQPESPLPALAFPSVRGHRHTTSSISAPPNTSRRGTTFDQHH